MKILYASRQSDGFWHSAILQRAGHEITLILEEDKYSDTLLGIAPPIAKKTAHPTEYDLVVFDTTGSGDFADALREHTPVIGDSQFASDIERDRLVGIEFMEKCNIPVPSYESFNDIGKATEWLKKHKRKAVFKPFGDVTDSATTYVAKSAEDMIRYMEKLLTKVKVKEFLLQEFVEGTEVSTEGWFNGENFFAVNHTLEEKKFLSGGLGPNTGCSGNVLWMPNTNNALFEQGLRRSADMLRTVGFVGPIDLNTIVTEGGIYGLEWTPRFGYEGTCNLMRLLPKEFGQFMYDIATGSDPMLEPAKANFAASIRITVPPYPNPSKPEKYAGVPVKGIDLSHLEAIYLSDVRKSDEEDELETLGTDGLIGAVIGVGDSIKQSFEECESYIKNLQIPDLQYRSDLAKCCANRHAELEHNGWLRTVGAISA